MTRWCASSRPGDGQGRSLKALGGPHPVYKTRVITGVGTAERCAPFLRLRTRLAPRAAGCPPRTGAAAWPPDCNTAQREVFRWGLLYLARQAIQAHDAIAAGQEVRQTLSLANEILRKSPEQPVVVTLSSDFDITTTYRPVKAAEERRRRSSLLTLIIQR